MKALNVFTKSDAHMQENATNPYLEKLNIVDFSFSQASTIFGYAQTDALSENAQKIVDKLNDFTFLSQDWDGEEAVPPDKGLIDKVITFVRNADKHDLPVFFVSPGPQGDIMLEYQTGTDNSEIIFETDGSTELLLSNRETVLENKADISQQEIIDRLKQFFTQ